MVLHIDMHILVTGATGYVGGRLVPRLLEKGYTVRATSRSLAKMQARYWAKEVELVPSDALNFASLVNALRGCDVAFYLVHSMVREQQDFAKADKEAAENFVRAAKETGLKRIIYLGGLGTGETLSKHLKSRKEVADIFMQSGIPTTVLRAAMIIGAGSASFEILRYLVDRLPFMVTPRWVQSSVQPISIVNVLTYLIGSLDHKEMNGHTYDIGGPEVTTYEKLMQTYAQEMGLPKRKLLRLRVLTPWLSSHWIGLVTPLPPQLGKPLAEGLANDVICLENNITKLIPQKLLNCQEAIRRALDRLHTNKVETSWLDAGKIPPAEWVDENDPAWAGGTIFQEKTTTTIEKPLEKVWESILKVGGKTGWHSPQVLWMIRGYIDKICGGVGLNRGRRNTTTLQVGDAVDFWRVNILEPNKRLQLFAEMKMPGKALLEFLLAPQGSDTELTVRASFLPHGLLGIFYWYSLFPFHFWIFRSMLNSFKSQILKNG